MDRYAFLADLVTAAANCVPNAPGCEYEVFVGLGVPPQECSYIAGSWTGSNVKAASANCRMMFTEQFELSLNRCCLKNVGEDFDAALEDDDAMCFIRDFGTMLECLACEMTTILQPYVKTAQDVSVKIARLDQTASGGCYGGALVISFDRYQPCPACP